MVTLAVWVVLVYALLVILGGIIGYLRARSLPSLIAGIVSGILLLIAFGASLSNEPLGLLLATVLATLLLIVFLMRFRRTGKFMPSGLMLSLSIIAAILFLVGMITAFTA